MGAAAGLPAVHKVAQHHLHLWLGHHHLHQHLHHLCLWQDHHGLWLGHHKHGFPTGGWRESEWFTWILAVHMLNCKINGTVHIFFLKKSYLSPRCPKLSQQTRQFQRETAWCAGIKQKSDCEFVCWTARSMERSIFFFLKIHISAPGERNCPNFFSMGVFP